MKNRHDALIIRILVNGLVLVKRCPQIKDAQIRKKIKQIHKPDREAFGELMDMCRSYALESNNATNPIIFEFMDVYSVGSPKEAA